MRMDNVLSGRSRRRCALPGVMSLAVLVGVGACSGQPDTQAARTTGSPAGRSPTTPPTSPAPTSRGAVTHPPTGPALSTSEQARVSAARKSVALGEASIGHPLPKKPVAPMRDVRVTQTGNLKKDGGILRVVSSRSDLTGQRELAWIADRGDPIGDARCTQKIRLSNNAKADVRKTLLICWRTSADRSVFTVAVRLDGKPSRRTSLAAIEKGWSQLG